MHLPHIAANRRNQHHNVVVPNSYGPGGWAGTWKPKPIGCKVEGGDDPTKQVEGRTATAKSMRATRGPAANHPLIAQTWPLSGSNMMSVVVGRPVVMRLSGRYKGKQA